MHCSSQAAFQLPGAGHETTIWSLDRDGHNGNVRLLDTATLTDPLPFAS